MSEPAFDQKEYDEAVAQAKADNASVYTHVFKKPFVYDGKEYSKLHFDFDKLTGADSLNVEDELSAQGIMVMVPTFSGQFLIRIAARACQEKIGVDGFLRMRIADMNRIRTKTRNFMLDSEQ